MSDGQGPVVRSTDHLRSTAGHAGRIHQLWYSWRRYYIEELTGPAARLGYGCQARCGYTARMSNSSPESAPLDLRPLPGSEQRALPRTIRAADPVPADTVIDVTLVLRRRAE